jgi:hypothetical protein
MHTARPLLSCPIAPLAIKASLMTIRAFKVFENLKSLIRNLRSKPRNPGNAQAFYPTTIVL